MTGAGSGWRLFRVVGLMVLSLLPVVRTRAVAVDDVPVNTQAPGESPLAPAEAVTRLRVPDGFQVTLAAAEPDVRQPIAITFDDRGRLWVAESYSYDGSKFTDEPHDRVLIFEDTTGDGVLDRRKVFFEGLTHLTGLEIGFGGVWITAPPALAFIPDANGDDIPDGEPIVHLDGWTVKAEHNNVNGLCWGPDGWFYGRHGIKQPSNVGRPGTPAEKRTELSCCIWRYHPTQHLFEVVADGTINPWGLDFDEHGQGFLTTSVVEHLWHLVPGAHFERWKDRGTHPNPYVYELMTATCDHLHWASNRFDKESRGAEGNQSHGGGHSHCDAMIYLGDRWPERYRGTILMSNIHGRRINCDRLVLEDGGYRGRHNEDFLIADDPWFRAVSMEYGPDGDVYVTDWSDNGECHDRDGVHRTSGRIYKVSWGAPRRVDVDLQKSTNDQLVAYQLHRNEWYVRHARRILQERAAGGDDMSEVQRQLRELFKRSDSVTHQLRALWTLHVTGGLDEEMLIHHLGHESEHVRTWAVRLLLDDGRTISSTSALAKIEDLARQETSWLGQMALASGLRHVPIGRRWSLLLELQKTRYEEKTPASRRDETSNLDRLIWYALEPEVAVDPRRALTDIAIFHPPLRRWIARRLSEDSSESIELLFEAVSREKSPELVFDMLSGFNAASIDSPRFPSNAAKVVGRLMSHRESPVRLAAVAAGARIGDAETLERLRRLLWEESTDEHTARIVLAGLVRQKVPGLEEDVTGLIASGRLVVPALQTAETLKSSRLIETVLDRYSEFSMSERGPAIDFLVSRRSSAKRLMQAIEDGTVEAAAISAEQARQIMALNDADLSRELGRLWGSTRPTPADRLQQIRDWEAKLTEAHLNEANLANGQMLFMESCAKCHKLFGEGQTIGPELTGSNRRNLHYLLSNVIDPSASVPRDFRLTVVATVDGRVVTGMLTAQSSGSVTIRTTNETVRIARDDVEELKTLPTSMMPDGLLDKLDEDQVRDLIAWMMSDGFVPSVGR